MAQPSTSRVYSVLCDSGITAVTSHLSFMPYIRTFKACVFLLGQMLCACVAIFSLFVKLSMHMGLLGPKYRHVMIKMNI